VVSKNFPCSRMMTCIVMMQIICLGHVYHAHNPDEWQFFIDSSEPSLKVVLLLYGNIYLSIPLAYSIHMKESHESMRTLINCSKYDKYK
jgi:hypothetical protein